MIAGALFKLFDFIARTRWAQIVLLCFAVVLTAGFYLAFRDNSVRKKVNAERDVEAAQATTEVVTNITRNTDEIVQNADTVRSAPAIVELPDGTKTLPDYHFRD